MIITIKDQVSTEINVEKSRFIAILIPLSDLAMIDTHLTTIKATYRDARHYCYAYRFEVYEKYSDDGEPKNTAGLPLLSLLQKRNLHDVLLVVVRYFGGIKLGAGRLLRTYVEAGVSVINQTVLYSRHPGVKLTLKIKHFELDNLIHELNRQNITIQSRIFVGFDVFVTVIVSTANAVMLENYYNINKREDNHIFKEYQNE